MYGHRIRVRGVFDTVVERTKETLLAHKFGILGDMNLAAALRYRLGVDQPSYRILGACWPQVAHKAIQRDPDMGLLLPCNVVVRQEDEQHCVIAFVAPEAVLGIADLPELADDARLVEEKLAEVRQALLEALNGESIGQAGR